ncbi:TerB family tellurite resistance protein [Anabaena sp. UHCC 0187]|uniref:TerB family tellurite resistance protein n=1 Tax=Anabaena sp. UHCC 0187 TaxID=2590018 RepID=UPI0014465426|nr:TerB family tellurite resistance protein [Anabaena sp. UHCC 0187]MTJ12267.1 TerB family tellurite resistance protein [Anabaena sp. UHCC 0187]
MEVLQSILKGILLISVAITALMTYLAINKIWPRKHELTVVQSRSLLAQILSISTTLPFLVYYSIHGDIKIALDNFIRLCMYIFLFLVAIGFWVKDPQHNGIWQKFIKAFKQEAKESTNLIKALTQPSGKKELLNILYRVAWLDDELNEKERQYIQMFADSWEIDPSHLFAEPPPEKGIEKFNKIREEVIVYLALQPSKEQVMSLSDVVQALINIDEEITKEEELIGAEISGILGDYGNQQKASLYGVMVHPNQEQEKSFLALMPNAKEEYILGNRAYIAGIFQTRPYAEAFSEYYREQKFFTIVHKYDTKTA